MFTLLFDIRQYLEIIKKKKKKKFFFFIKNFNILKIFHSNITEKIAFRKPIFQLRITNFFFFFFFFFLNQQGHRSGQYALQSFWRLWQHEQ